jgi:hypothetical protein
MTSARLIKKSRTYIQQYIPDVTDQEMKLGRNTGALEVRIIDGQKRYFNNAALICSASMPDVERSRKKRRNREREGI